jgi:hypothetical protein
MKIYPDRFRAKLSFVKSIPGDDVGHVESGHEGDRNFAGKSVLNFRIVSARNIVFILTKILAGKLLRF